MHRTYSFSPDWVSPPGATVLDLMEERRVSIKDFAIETRRSTNAVARFLNGIEPLTNDWAIQLTQYFGASIDFWLRREEQYRNGLLRLYKEKNQKHAIEWLNEIPTKDMQLFGWIPKSESKEDLLLTIFSFFGVTSVESWRDRYADITESIAYRTSTAFEIKTGSVATWIRQGEILAQEIDCSPWNPKLFRESLPLMRDLTKISEPQVFLPKLVELCSRCGVAVVIAPLPNGCRASGATKFISSDKALMLLSFRYLSDDQFWFTVFHEAGHLLLHAKDGVFLEGVADSTEKAEAEANNFALSALFTKAGLEQLKTLTLTNLSIARFARRLGISAGLVVGQLQKMERIPFKHFNFLKRHYKWIE